MKFPNKALELAVSVEVFGQDTALQDGLVAYDEFLSPGKPFYSRFIIVCSLLEQIHELLREGCFLRLRSSYEVIIVLDQDFRTAVRAAFNVSSSNSSAPFFQLKIIIIGESTSKCFPVGHLCFESVREVYSQIGYDVDVVVLLLLRCCLFFVFFLHMNERGGRQTFS